MTGLELRLRESLSSERIEDISIEQLTQSVSQLIAQTYIMVGYQTYNERDIGILAAKLSSDLRESYAYLTFPEVSLCFELGAKGTFGDYTGVNLRTFARWLKGYKTSYLRYHAVVERERERRQNALPPVSEAYKEERELAFLRKVFQQYKAGYPLERLYPARVYQSLQERGLIHDTPEEKRHAMSLFAHWRPPGHLPISEDYRLTMVRQQAMAWLLRRYFDGLIAKEKA